jgi:hypothetical protein
MLWWDGALPLSVMIIPALIRFLFANRQGFLEITFVVIPVVAFLIRMASGMSRFRSQQMYWWQLTFFFVAIFLLCVLDALLVLHALIQGPPPAGFWLVCLTIYAIYLAIIAIAMYPLRIESSSDST